MGCDAWAEGKTDHFCAAAEMQDLWPALPTAWKGHDAQGWRSEI